MILTQERIKRKGKQKNNKKQRVEKLNELQRHTPEQTFLMHIT